MKQLCLLFVVLSLFCASLVVAEEENSIMRAEDYVAPQEKSHVYRILPGGENLPEGESLPEGYHWERDGSLHLPDDVVLAPSGELILPKNEYPERYKISPDGKILAPSGVVLEQPVTQEEERELSIEELLDIEARLAEKEQQEAKEEQKPKKKAALQAPKQPVQKKAKKGDSLEIPREAYAKRDYSFLAGCWREGGYDSHSWNTNRLVKISYTRFCFDRNGRGQYEIHEAQGAVFRGPSTARFRGKQLNFANGNAYSNSRSDRYYTPSSYQCLGSSSSTQCHEVSVNPHNAQDVRHRDTRLRKE